MKTLFRTLGLGAISAVSLMVPTSAQAQSLPGVYWTIVPTGYGQLGCLQRAEAKLYAVGATNIHRNNKINVFGDLTNERIGIMCRGNEAIIIVAGQNPGEVREEISKAF